LEYDLIYLDEDDITELVTGPTGYWVSVYTYYSGVLYTLIDKWGYGMGNVGFEYARKKNIVRLYNQDFAGAIINEIYFTVNDDFEIQLYYDEILSYWRFDGINGNRMVDEGENTDDEKSALFTYAICSTGKSINIIVSLVYFDN